MTRDTKRKNVFRPQMGIYAIFILWSLPANAAYLKDIRIGEYEGFTRIVFELDAPVTNQAINPQASGQLVVTLNQTEPLLKRKIPVERSKHVRSIQLWHRKGNLTTRFQLDYDHFRFEYFPLTNPPRLALDVYPLTAQPAPSNTMETRQDESQIRKIRESSLSTANKSVQSNPVSQDPAGKAVPAKPDPQTPGLVDDTPETKDETAFAKPRLAKDIKPTETTSDALPQVKYRDTTQPPVAEPPSPKTNTLQFYLVIILVAITIIILALLLVMLLGKRRWTDETNEMNVHEFLKTQDERIASINERIKEQFKRYEEAG